MKEINNGKGKEKIKRKGYEKKKKSIQGAGRKENDVDKREKIDNTKRKERRNHDIRYEGEAGGRQLGTRKNQKNVAGGITTKRNYAGSLSIRRSKCNKGRDKYIGKEEIKIWKTHTHIRERNKLSPTLIAYTVTSFIVLLVKTALLCCSIKRTKPEDNRKKQAAERYTEKRSRGTREEQQKEERKEERRTWLREGAGKRKREEYHIINKKRREGKEKRTEGSRIKEKKMEEGEILHRRQTRMDEKGTGKKRRNKGRKNWTTERSQGMR